MVAKIRRYISLSERTDHGGVFEQATTAGRGLSMPAAKNSKQRELL